MSLPILLAQLKIANVRTLASSVHEPHDGEPRVLSPWEEDWSEPVALLVGNDARIRIPMASGIESLNAAAAAAVLFYEAARQRHPQP
jgi:tRNA G18 (ribose-2'-O)-methylase SpoU